VLVDSIRPLVCCGGDTACFQWSFIDAAIVAAPCGQLGRGRVCPRTVRGTRPTLRVLLLSQSCQACPKLSFGGAVIPLLFCLNCSLRMIGSWSLAGAPMNHLASIILSLSGPVFLKLASQVTFELKKWQCSL
jgi:hypothetical protein